MWARIESGAVAEIIAAPRAIEVPATVINYVTRVETLTRQVERQVPGSNPPETETVDEEYEVTHHDPVEVAGTKLLPAGAFTLWPVEELAAVGIVPASYADEPPSPRHAATGTAWEVTDGEAVGTRTWELPAGTAHGIMMERARRLALGFGFDFQDGRGVHHIGTTDADLKGWDEVSKIAAAAIAVGQPSTPLAIVTNTGPVTVTALEWQSILLAAGAFRQPIWAASFVLQAMDPIPGDYTDDAYWQPAP